MPVHPTPIRCHLCGAACESEDYCFGCRKHVCEACDHPDQDKRPQGIAHVPEAHLVREGSAS